jgi:hypothetical protein
MVHGDGSRMVYAFFGLTCQEFLVVETCDKGWTVEMLHQQNFVADGEVLDL